LAHRREQLVKQVRTVYREPQVLRVVRVKLVPLERQVHKVFTVLRVRLV
jgi:hypothetical protein